MSRELSWRERLFRAARVLGFMATFLGVAPVDSGCTPPTMIHLESRDSAPDWRRAERFEITGERPRCATLDHVVQDGANGVVPGAVSRGPQTSDQPRDQTSDQGFRAQLRENVRPGPAARGVAFVSR